MIASPLADALFSPVQQRVLGLLFGSPQQRFQSAELIRRIQAGTGGVHRLLQRWASSGLLRVETIGHQKFYQANPESPVFAELCGLVDKTLGMTAVLKQALLPLAERVHAAFVYGSVAKGHAHSYSDVDLMIVSDDLDYATVYAALALAESTLGRSVNPSLMTLGQWRSKRAEPDGFVSRIAQQSREFILGCADDIG